MPYIYTLKSRFNRAQIIFKNKKSPIFKVHIIIRGAHIIFYCFKIRKYLGFLTLWAQSILCTIFSPQPIKKMRKKSRKLFDVRHLLNNLF